MTSPDPAAPVTPVPAIVTPLTTLLSPGGRRGRLSVLMYHRVLAEPDPLMPGTPTAEVFRWQMRLLAERFNPLPLAEAIDRLYADDLPPRAIAVSFDDGYADNLRVALPVLEQLSVPATFFVASGFLDGGRMWNDSVFETVRRLPDGLYRPPEQLGLDPINLHGWPSRRELGRALIGKIKYLPLSQRQRVVDDIAAAVDGLPDDLMLSSDELRTLNASPQAAVGGHTVNHPILSGLDDADAREEIGRGKNVLEEKLDMPLTLFAYPNGRPGDDYLPPHAEMVRELGYRAAFSTVWGVSTAATDRYQIPRFTPWDKTPLRFWQRLLRNCRRPVRAQS